MRLVYLTTAHGNTQPTYLVHLKSGSRRIGCKSVPTVEVLQTPIKDSSGFMSIFWLIEVTVAVFLRLINSLRLIADTL